MKVAVVRGLLFGVLYATGCSGFGIALSLFGLLGFSILHEWVSGFVFRGFPSDMRVLRYVVYPPLKAAMAAVPLYFCLLRIGWPRLYEIFKYREPDPLGPSLQNLATVALITVWIFLEAIIQVRRNA
jgi:hypothetical protein